MCTPEDREALEARYLRALFMRDAGIWAERMQTLDGITSRHEVESARSVGRPRTNTLPAREPPNIFEDEVSVSIGRF